MTSSAGTDVSKNVSNPPGNASKSSNQTITALRNNASGTMNKTGPSNNSSNLGGNTSLIGNLVKGDYVLLMDLTPFATSVEGHSHIAMKIPCDKDGIPKATIMLELLLI